MDKIHLQLEGSSGKKCEIKFLDKNDIFYHHAHGKFNGKNVENVPCNEKFTISTEAAYPVYYLQVESNVGTEHLKLVYSNVLMGEVN